MCCNTQNQSIHNNDNIQPAVKSCSGQENPIERHNVNLCDEIKKRTKWQNILTDVRKGRRAAGQKTRGLKKENKEWQHGDSRRRGKSKM